MSSIVDVKAEVRFVEEDPSDNHVLLALRKRVLSLSFAAIAIS